jgi:hypothetical protein
MEGFHLVNVSFGSICPTFGLESGYVFQWYSNVARWLRRSGSFEQGMLAVVMDAACVESKEGDRYALHAEVLSGRLITLTRQTSTLSG